MPSRTLRVTLECAGNGRAALKPRYQSMPWVYEAVGTAEWTGTPLRNLLEPAGLLDDVVEVSFHGADRGFDRGTEHEYGRSLKPEVALGEDVLVVWAMNGQPLLPQHGFPLRMVVPGWYGMASVKWLNRIEALDKPYEGYQQVGTYMYRSVVGGPATPVTHMRVKSLLVPPGIPDFYSRARITDRGRHTIHGRAWSGAACRSRASSLASTAPGPTHGWTTPRANTPGAAGAPTGRPRPASTSWPAAPPTPTATCSRSRVPGTQPGSATTACSACTSG